MESKIKHREAEMSTKEQLMVTRSATIEARVCQHLVFS
jgi:hypothetical protein